jgi:hypothetical protein
LSEEDVGKLDDVDATIYLTWLEKRESEQKQKTIVERKRLDENKEKAITIAQEADKE